MWFYMFNELSQNLHIPKYLTNTQIYNIGSKEAAILERVVLVMLSDRSIGGRRRRGRAGRRTNDSPLVRKWINTPNERI